MKRGHLQRALQARKELDKPEPEPKPVVETLPPSKLKRFHTSLYPDRQVYDEIKIALIREGKGRDFNKLVNDLLAEWLDAHGD